MRREEWSTMFQGPGDGEMALLAYTLMLAMQDVAAGLRDGQLLADGTRLRHRVERSTNDPAAVDAYAFLTSDAAQEVCDEIMDWSGGRFKVSPEGLLHQASVLARELSVYSRHGTGKRAPLSPEERLARRKKRQAYQRGYQATYPRASRAKEVAA